MSVFTSTGAELAEIIDLIHNETLTAEAAGPLIAALLEDISPSQFLQLAKVEQAMGRMTNMLFVEGVPDPTLGAPGSSAIDITNRNFYGPKDAITGWPAPIQFVGDTGPSGTITSATASTGAAGSSASVTLGGTPQARTMAFTIPRGDTGASGTITSATAVTGAPGSNVSLALGGTPEARTIEFTIPRGDTGANAAALDLFASADRYNLVNDTKRNAFMAKGVELLFTSGSYRAGVVAAVSPLALPGATYTRAGAATAEMANGTIVNFAANVPRITDKGQLVEPASTNLVINSVFANTGGAAPTSWSQPLGTGTSVAAASTRNSGVSAWSQTATAERPTIATPAITYAINSTYQISMVVEAVTGNLTAVDLLRIGTTPAGSTVTFPVCSANPTGGLGGVVQPGLLVMQVVTVGTGGTTSTWFGIGGNGAATGTLRFSCPMVELQTQPTSFIPTTTAAATRAADSPYLSGDYSIERTTLIEFERVHNQPNGQFPTLFQYTNDPLDTEITTSFISSTGDLVGAWRRVGGVIGQQLQSPTPAGDGAVSAITLSETLTGYRETVSGTPAIGTTSAQPVPTTKARFYWGNGQGAAQIGGYVRRVVHFPFSMTDEEQQALSNLSTAPAMAVAKTMDATLDLMARASLYGITDISQALAFARTGIEAVFTTPYYRKGLLGGTSINALSPTFTRASVGTARNLAGVYQSFASGILRNTDRGGLIEDSRTNLCTNHNANPTEAVGYVGNCVGVLKTGDAAAVLSVVDDTAALTAAGLSGICTSGKVYKVDNSAGVGDAYITILGNVASTAQHYGSVFLRGTGAGAVQFRSTGASVEGVTTAALTAGYVRRLLNLNGLTGIRSLQFYVPAGVVLYFILNQLETGPGETSPVIVAGAAATRAADLLTTPSGVASGQDFTHWGTVVFEGEPASAALTSFDDATTSHRVRAYRVSGIIYFEARVSGVATALATVSGKAGARTVKFAIRRAGTSYTAFVDGVAYAPVSVTGMPTLGRYTPGYDIGSGVRLNDYMPRYGLAFSALPDAVCLALTA